MLFFLARISFVSFINSHRKGEKSSSLPPSQYGWIFVNERRRVIKIALPKVQDDDDDDDKHGMLRPFRLMSHVMVLVPKGLLRCHSSVHRVWEWGIPRDFRAHKHCSRTGAKCNEAKRRTVVSATWKCGHIYKLINSRYLTCNCIQHAKHICCQRIVIWGSKTSSEVSLTFFFILFFQILFLFLRRI